MVFHSSQKVLAKVSDLADIAWHTVLFSKKSIGG